MKRFLLGTLAAVSFLAAPAAAQVSTGAPAGMQPALGCTATAAQLDANRRIAMAFFTAPTPDARIALADPSYKQHNPAFVKRAAADHLSDYDEFKQTFSGRASAAQDVPGTPAGNPFEIVTAQCDIVSIVHRRNVQDPTAPAGTYYPVFTFDAFRVTNGKLTEHWDGAVITPPAP